MNAVFDAANGTERALVDLAETADSLAIESTEMVAIAQYLEGEGLIKCIWTLGPTLPTVSLTHPGIVEIEEQRSAPTQSTSHFPAFNVITIHGDIVNSQLQQSSPGAQQQVEYNLDQRRQVQDFVAEVRRYLPELGLAEEDQNALEADLQTAEIQAKSPRPSTGIIKHCLKAIKAVLISAASTEVQSQLLDLLNHIPH